MASVRKRGNTYQITVSDGYFLDGRKRTRTATFTPDPDRTDRQNERELQYFIADFERAVKAGAYYEGEKMTFKELVSEWERIHGQILERKTLESYQQILNTHILPEFGSFRVSRIKTIHLNRLYEKLSQERKDGLQGGYSAATIRRFHGVLSSVFTFAVKSGLLEASPCTNATIPKTEARRTPIEQKCFTATQTALFLDFIGKPYKSTVRPSNRAEYVEIRTVPEQLQIFFQMAILCGCRRSELIALQWSDIDLEKEELSITKATVAVKGDVITKAPKTPGSFRKISIPSPLAAALRQYHVHQMERRLQIGSKWEDGNYLFTQWNGRQMRPESPYKHFRRILERYNSEHKEDPLPLITLHDLRHTSATLLISENTDIRTVSQRLGHSRTSTTLNIYAHALESKDKAAAEALADLVYKRA